MNILNRAAVSVAGFVQSPILRRTLATFTDSAYILIDVHGGNLAIKSSGSTPYSDICALQSVVARVDQEPGKITSIDPIDPSIENLPPLTEDGRPGGWIAYACKFENGAVDHIYLRLRKDKPAELDRKSVV